MSISTHINRITSEVSAQAAALAEVQTALQGKAGIVSAPKTCTLTITSTDPDDTIIKSCRNLCFIVFDQVVNGVVERDRTVNFYVYPGADSVMGWSTPFIGTYVPYSEANKQPSSLILTDIVCGSDVKIFHNSEAIGSYSICNSSVFTNCTYKSFCYTSNTSSNALSKVTMPAEDGAVCSMALQIDD